MSDTLTDAAPAENEAVPPVGVEAPVVTSEVDAGSGDGRFVPVERFNGLMSSFNRAQTQVSALERQLSELRSELNTKPAQEEPKQVSDEISTRLQRLEELLVEERMKNVRHSVLDDYPEVKPFADLIVADTEEDLRQMAKLLSERVKGLVPAPTNTEVTEPEPTTQVTEPAVPAVEEPPVVGGGTAYVGGAAVEDKVTDAIRRRSFKDFLAARWEQMDIPDEQAS